jgi:hypothetical protein
MLYFPRRLHPITASELEEVEFSSDISVNSKVEMLITAHFGRRNLK